MLSTVAFECEISATDPNSKLQFELRVNDRTIFTSNSITQPTKITADFPNDEQQTFCLQFIMSGKTPSDTAIDDQGNIVKDVMLSVDNIMIDDIDLKHLFLTKSIYSHNFNGTGPDTEERFYGHMGCNGTVTFEFATPFYLWLLENM